MCGRFTITDPLDEIIERFMASIADGFEYRPNYNAAPMQYIPTIIDSKNGNRLGAVRWGLVPSWAKDDKIGNKMINARAETLTEKTSFKRLISSKRYIIPTNGFYEWKRESSNKQLMRIIMKDDSIFSLAGLYVIWTDPDGKKLSTCTIITTEPNSLMQDKTFIIVCRLSFGMKMKQNGLKRRIMKFSLYSACSNHIKHLK